MNFYHLWLRGNTDDKTLAFVRDDPTSIGNYEYCMRQGERLSDHYPEGVNIKIKLDKRSPGIKLQALLGNLLSYLMVNTAAKDLIVSTCQCEIEALPFVLYNHKNRIHSKDYWILNPIGTFDCVNRAASNIQYLDTDPNQVTGVGLTPGSLVFDPAKLNNAPDLFRVPEEPARMFISEKLMQAMKAHDLHKQNFLLVEVMKQKPVK
jgi:hypothetical protein